MGETRLFDIATRSPLEWVNNDAVIFLTWNGTARIDLATGTVIERTDPSITPPNPHPERSGVTELPLGAQYGPWAVTSGGFALIAHESGDVQCGALLVSPNGEYVACHYIVTDRMAESSEGAAAVIRLR